MEETLRAVQPDAGFLLSNFDLICSLYPSEILIPELKDEENPTARFNLIANKVVEAITQTEGWDYTTELLSGREEKGRFFCNRRQCLLCIFQPEEQNTPSLIKIKFIAKKNQPQQVIFLGLMAGGKSLTSGEYCTNSNEIPLNFYSLDGDKAERIIVNSLAIFGLIRVDELLPQSPADRHPVMVNEKRI